MAWLVIYCNEFAAEFMKFPKGLQDELLTYQEMLSDYGPRLGRPIVDTLKGSKLSNLKELRFVWQRDPYRFLFAFDPKRRAIILIGGSKTSNKRFYLQMIKIAERRYKNFIHEEKNNERNSRRDHGFSST